MIDIISEIEKLKNDFQSYYPLEINGYNTACDDIINYIKNSQKSEIISPCEKYHKTRKHYLSANVYIKQCENCKLIIS
jgi:hypothetical protein